MSVTVGRFIKTPKGLLLMVLGLLVGATDAGHRAAADEQRTA